MAIALDTSATVFSGVSATGTESHSYTVTGSNPVLFVGIYAAAGTDFVSSVTYNSVPVNRVGALLRPEGGRSVYLYVLSGPSTGANTLTVVLASVVKADILASSYTGAASFSGSSVDNSTTKVDTGTNTSTLTLTPTVDNCWTLIQSLSVFSTSMAAGTGTTQRQNPTGIDLLGDSNAAIHPVAATSMTVNTAGADNIASIMVSFAPFISVTPPVVSAWLPGQQILRGQLWAPVASGMDPSEH